MPGDKSRIYCNQGIMGTVMLVSGRVSGSMHSCQLSLTPPGLTLDALCTAKNIENREVTLASQVRTCEPNEAWRLNHPPLPGVWRSLAERFGRPPNCPPREQSRVISVQKQHHHPPNGGVSNGGLAWPSGGQLNTWWGRMQFLVRKRPCGQYKNGFCSARFWSGENVTNGCMFPGTPNMSF